ncbi:MAG TPA: DUF4419 domain-containing protein [Herpetosiphonaceae bacterium]
MIALAPVVRQTAQAIEFEVDAVEPCSEPLPASPVRARLEALVGSRLVALSHDPACAEIRETARHPLVSAVHLAFSQHRPLTLSPDAIWLTIAQGFANHVRNQPEKLRSRLVGHQGKLTLETKVDHGLDQDWADAIADWTAQLKALALTDLPAVLECGFSTTTPASLVASRIVLLDIFRHYADYLIYLICGIPRVTLRGTPADWRSIYERAEKLAAYDLNWWTDRLLPVCEGLVRTAEGAPPLIFWQHIYMPAGMYGNKLITGWLADLFPYLKPGANSDAIWRNPILALRRADLLHDDTVRDGPSERKAMDDTLMSLLFRDDGPPPAPEPEPDIDPGLPRRIGFSDGVDPDSVPAGLTEVPFILDDGATRRRRRLVAGFVGLLATEDGGMEPEIGWGVAEGTALELLLDRIAAEHAVAPPLGPRSRRPDDRVEMPKELFQLLDRFNGATLFAGTPHPWRLLPCAEYETRCLPEGGSCRHSARFADLPDGRCLVACHTRDPRDDSGEYGWYVTVGVPLAELSFGGRRMNGHPILAGDRWPVIAVGVTQLLERILAYGGAYYFDAPDFVPDAVIQSDKD